MNWLTNYVRPKIRALLRDKREVPENLWVKCPSCERMIFHRELAANLHVCPHCGHHMRVGPATASTRCSTRAAGSGSRCREARPTRCASATRRSYADRLREAQAKTKAGDAGGGARPDRRPAGGDRGPELRVHGRLDGHRLGEGFVAAAEHAVRSEAALVVVTASGGARMQEGTLSLMQMARTTVAVEEVKEAGLPYIVS